jgi:hypothetical protein
MLSHCSYLTPKEGNAAYEQQGDIILKLEYFLLQSLLVILNDSTFLCQIYEILKKDLLAINLQGQLRSHHQVIMRKTFGHGKVCLQ